MIKPNIPLASFQFIGISLKDFFRLFSDQRVINLNVFSLGEATSSKRVDRDLGGTVVVWHIVVSLILGVVIGCLLSYIVSCFRRKFRSEKPRQSNPERPKPQIDKTYEELDLTNLNIEENYQSLTMTNQSTRNDDGNEDDSNYTELSKTREAEKTYQSLT